uniref:Putative secreted protein n=1 Tax=Anopheles darlingi TaxID=43151 RepID=A0A2M4DHG3_ANODA
MLMKWYRLLHVSFLQLTISYQEFVARGYPHPACPHNSEGSSSAKQPVVHPIKLPPYSTLHPVRPADINGLIRLHLVFRPQSHTGLISTTNNSNTSSSSSSSSSTRGTISPWHGTIAHRSSRRKIEMNTRMAR